MEKNYRDSLKTLAVFHYVFAGLGFMIALFMTIYIVLGTILSSGLPSDLRDAMASGEDMPPEFANMAFQGVGTILLVFGATMFLFALGISILSIYSGRKLAQQQKYTFSLVFAGFICVLFPFGTVLGIITLIYLCKSEVKALYDSASTPAQAPNPATYYKS